VVHPWSDATWAGFFHYTYIILPFALGTVITVWFTWGSLKDIVVLFRRLKTVTENPLDDGTVAAHHNLSDDPNAASAIKK
jgi:hypothetical protein